MPQRKRPRPSFNPAAPPAAEAPRTTTGWVYRSEASAPGSEESVPPPPRAPEPLAVARTIPHAPPPRRRGPRVLDALSVPFTFVIVTSMPIARVLRWPRR